MAEDVKMPQFFKQSKKKKTQGSTFVKRKKLRSALNTFINAQVPLAGRSLIETKAIDTRGLNQAVTANASFNLLNGLNQGSNSYQRSGRKINVKSIHVVGNLNDVGASSAGYTNDYIRVVILYDKQCDAAAPTWANIFADVDKGGSVTADAYSDRNLDNSDRFIVLRDMRYKLGPHGTSAAAPNLANAQEESAQTMCKWIFNEFIKLPGDGLPVQYQATTNVGDITDIQTGSILLVHQGSNTAANSTTNIWWKCRVRFVDL